MNKVLFLSKKMDPTGRSPWLVDELVEEFLSNDWAVDVLLVDVTAEWEKGVHRPKDGLRVHAFPVLGSGLGKMFYLGLAYLNILRFVLLGRLDRYDFVVGFSIASFFFGVLNILKLRGKVGVALLILWDFFPIHQIEIGRLKSGFLSSFLKFVEMSSIKPFDYVGLMSERNVSFFNSYHPEIESKTLLVPVWGKGVEGNRRGNNNGGLSIVFGGQLCRGRGIQEIVKLAKIIKEEGGGQRIFVYGDGELSHVIRDEAMHNDCLVYKGRVSREIYLEELRSYDCGLVITVPGVSVPTFPSKVIDYLRVGLPIISCVEDSTDFGAFVEEEAMAGISVPVGNVNDIYSSVCFFSNLKKSGELNVLGESGRNYYMRNMEVSYVYKKIESLVE